jgi:hypothetical protein
MGNVTILDLTISDQSDESWDEDMCGLAEVFLSCIHKYRTRNEERNGVWKRSGLKGQTEEVYAKAERAFVEVFQLNRVPNRDHYVDCINYAAFALVLMAKFHVEGIGSHDSVRQTWLRERKLLNGDWPWEA